MEFCMTEEVHVCNGLLVTTYMSLWLLILHLLSIMFCETSFSLHHMLCLIMFCSKTTSLNLLHALLKIKVHCSICELKIVSGPRKVQNPLCTHTTNLWLIKFRICLYKNALCTITIWREWWSLLSVSHSVFRMPSSLVLLFCRLSFLSALDPLMLTAFDGCLHFLESELVCCLTMIRLDYSETKLMCGWLIFASGHMKNT